MPLSRTNILTVKTAGPLVDEKSRIGNHVCAGQAVHIVVAQACDVVL